MSFIAPWALVVGGIAAAGTVLLHLLVRQRPAAYVLPTARFIVERPALVSRFATRPRDLLLLAVRVLLLISAAVAFAQPVLVPRHAPRARLVLLDRSAAPASEADALARVRMLLSDGVPTRVIAFDSAATVLADAVKGLDSLGRSAVRGSAHGSIAAALVAARRAGADAGTTADSVELVLVSPVTAAELDPSIDSVRAQWPGSLSVVRLVPRPPSNRAWTLERAIAADDPLGPAMSGVRAAASPSSVRLRRDSLTSADSAFARGGGTVVRWDTTGAIAPAALAMGDDVVVAALGRGPPPERGRVIARWAAGVPAAREEGIGAGCIRTVAVGLPLVGDLALRPAFQRVVRGMLAPCDAGDAPTPADSAMVARLAGHGAAAPGVALSAGASEPAPIVPWLLAIALACALTELIVRARPMPQAA